MGEHAIQQPSGEQFAELSQSIGLADQQLFAAPHASQSAIGRGVPIASAALDARTVSSSAAASSRRTLVTSASCAARAAAGG